MHIRFLWLCFGGIAIITPAAKAAATDGTPGRNAIVAEIDGVAITRADLEQRKSADLFQAKTNFYQAERRALDALVDEYLLKRQAEREHITVDELVKRHVTSSMPKDPSEEALRVYYAGIDTNEFYEAVRDKILEHLRQRRLETARAAYVQSLRAQARINIKLEATRADLALEGAPLRGVPDAPVVVVEYADYECPYCQQIEPDLKKLQQEYKGSTRVTFVLLRT